MAKCQGKSLHNAGMLSQSLLKYICLLVSHISKSIFWYFHSTCLFSLNFEDFLNLVSVLRNNELVKLLNNNKII